MPLLYGEGMDAFLRLQHEIIKISDDESKFFSDSDRCCMLVELLTRSHGIFKDCRSDRNDQNIQGRIGSVQRVYVSLRLTSL